MSKMWCYLCLQAEMVRSGLIFVEVYALYYSRSLTNPQSNSGDHSPKTKRKGVRLDPASKCSVQTDNMKEVYIRFI